MSRLKIAVIGAGHLGRIHARLLAQIPEIDLVAVAEPSEAAQQLIKEQSDVELIGDYRELIGRIDAAVIATPTRTHYDIASNLLESGIHVLCEKPLTDSVSDAKLLVAAARRNGVVVAVGHCERFNASIRAAAEQVGQPKFIQCARMSAYTYRSTDIGVVHDLMIHDIDLVNSLFPGEVIDTRANGLSVFSGREDIAQARIQFSCGGVANLTASRASFKPERSIQIFGTDGFASVDLANHQVDFVRVPSWIKNREVNFAAATPEQVEFVKENLFTQILPRQQTEVEPVNAILCEQQDWIEAIRFGGEPRVNVEAGSQAVAIAQSVLDSLAVHNWGTSQPGMTGPYATPLSHGFSGDPLPEQMSGMQLAFRKAG
ncbi:MAG: Gfo/Idh/MocA family oxidoreductase [Planctomycetota bacterium]